MGTLSSQQSTGTGYAESEEGLAPSYVIWSLIFSLTDPSHVSESMEIRPLPDMT